MKTLFPLTKSGYAILLFWLLSLTVTLTITGCASQKGGCKATSGYSGYGH